MLSARRSRIVQRPWRCASCTIASFGFTRRYVPPGDRFLQRRRARVDSYIPARRGEAVRSMVEAGWQAKKIALAEFSATFLLGVRGRCRAIQPPPDNGGKWQVSTGGVFPVWSHNGRELF